MIEDNKIEQMATVISNFCDKHQYDLTEQEIDDIALDMADKGYGNVSEYKAEREMLGSQIKVLKQRLNDKYIEVDNLNRDYRNAFERLKSQQREIDRLKAENEELTKVVSSKVYDLIGNVKEIADAREAWEKQAKIDVLNELTVKAVSLSAIETYHICNLVDELLKEYE